MYDFIPDSEKKPDLLKRKPSSSSKSNVEKILSFIPIVGFLLGYVFGNFYIATKILMGTMVLYWVILVIIKRKPEWVLLGITGLVLFFGLLTLYFHDPLFLKIKVSIIEGIFGVVLLTSYFIKKPLFTKLLSNEPIPPRWLNIITRNYGWFSIAMSIVNLMVAFQFSNTVWIWFKVIGLMGLSIVFFLAHLPLYIKYEKQNSNEI